MPENYRRRIERLERSSAFRPGNAEVKPREKKRQNLRGVNHGNSNADRTRATTKLPLLSRGGTPQLKPWLKKRGKKAADKGGQGSRGAGFASHSRRNAVPGRSTVEIFGLRTIIVLDGNTRIGAVVVKPDMLLLELRTLISQCFDGILQHYSFLKDDLVVTRRAETDLCTDDVLHYGDFNTQDGDAAVIFLKSIQSLKYNPDVYLQYPMGKNTVSPAFKKKNERRLRERQRRGQNHVRVYDPSDFDSSFADKSGGENFDLEQEGEVDDDASEASTTTAIADMGDPARARSTSRQRRRSSGTGNFRKKFNKDERGHSKSRSEQSPDPCTDTSVLRKYDLDRATAVYYEGPFEHESAPPEVNIVIQHCGVDGLFIRAFNAPADGPVRVRLEDSVYLGSDTMAALFADFSELLASATDEQAPDLESSALLLANPASSFLFYAAREAAPGALRVLTLNRSVFDYDLVDEADGFTYRLEVFVEEGSLHIEAQCLSDVRTSSNRYPINNAYEVYVCTKDVRRIDATVAPPQHIADQSVFAKVCSQCRFLAGPDGTKVLDIPRTLDNTFDVTCPRIHVFSAAVGLKSFQGEVRPFHLEFLEKLPRGQGIHHSDDKFQAGDNNGRSSPFSGNFIDSKREQPRFVVIAKGLSGLEQEYELGISQTEVSKMAAWIGQPLLATRAHVAQACRFMARRIFLDNSLALNALAFRWEAGLYIHRHTKTFPTGETLQLAAVLTLEWSVVVTVNAEDVAIVRAVLSPKSQLQQDDDVFHDSVEKTSALGQALPRNKSWQPLVLTAADCMTVVGDLSALKSKASRKKTFEQVIDRLKVDTSGEQNRLILLTPEGAEMEKAAVQLQRIVKGRQARQHVADIRQKRAEMTKQRRQAATTIQASIRRKQATAAAAKRKKAVVAEQNLLLNRKASQIQKLARGRLGKKKAVQMREQKRARAKAATKVQGLFRQREAKLEIARIKERQTKKQIMLEEFKGPDGRNVHIQIVAVPGDGLLFKAVSKVVVEAVAVDASNSKGENGQYSKVPADGKTKANQGRGNSHDNNSMHVRTRLPGAARGDRRRAQKAAATKLKAIEAVATTFFFSQTTLEALWPVKRDPKTGIPVEAVPITARQRRGDLVKVLLSKEPAVGRLAVEDMSANKVLDVDAPEWKFLPRRVVYRGRREVTVLESFNCPEVECDFQFEVTEGGFIMTVTEVQSQKPSKSAWHRSPAPFHLRTYCSLPDAVKLVHSGLLQRARHATDAKGTATSIADHEFDIVLKKTTADFTANDFQELCQQLHLQQVFGQSKPSSPKGRMGRRHDSSDEEDEENEDNAEPAFFMDIPREVQIVDSEYGRVVFCDVVSVLQPQIPKGTGLERRTFVCRVLDMQVLHENAPTSVGALEDSDFDRFHVSLEDVTDSLNSTWCHITQSDVEGALLWNKCEHLLLPRHQAALCEFLVERVLIFHEGDTQRTQTAEFKWEAVRFKIEEEVALRELRTSVCGIITLDWRVILHISAGPRKAASSTMPQKTGRASQASPNVQQHEQVEEIDDAADLEPLCEIVLDLDAARQASQAPKAFTKPERFELNMRKLMSFLEVNQRTGMIQIGSARAKDRHRAARNIQKEVRKNLAAKKVAILRHELRLESREHAALKVQKVYRGSVVRHDLTLRRRADFAASLAGEEVHDSTVEQRNDTSEISEVDKAGAKPAGHDEHGHHATTARKQLFRKDRTVGIVDGPTELYSFSIFQCDEGHLLISATNLATKETTDRSLLKELVDTKFNSLDDLVNAAVLTRDEHGLTHVTVPMA